MEDTQKELERIERELLAEEVAAAEEEMLDALLEPAFDDPEKIHEPEDPMVYCNYSNDYGKDLKEFAENGGKETMRKKKKNDKAIIGLMITACALCLGILGVLIYWLEVFLA